MLLLPLQEPPGLDVAIFFPGQGPLASPNPHSAALPHADQEHPPQGGRPVVARVMLPGTELQLFSCDGHAPPPPLWSPASPRTCAGLSESQIAPWLTFPEPPPPSPGL